MKRQIRRSVFETNSSSEHSLAIVNTDEFKQWVEGKLVARSKGRKEGAATGNFWSYLHEMEFAPSEEKDKRNIAYIEENFQKYYNPEDGWKTYKTPEQLIATYKERGIEYFGMHLYATYQEYQKFGFDSERPLHFSHELDNGKTIIGDYYHT